MIPMKGKLVTLEPLDIPKHAQGYFRVCQDERIHKFTNNSVPQTVEETTALLQKYEHYFINWMILSNETGQVIGMIRLGKPAMEDGHLVAGESQFLSPEYWRKGHMKEAKRLFYRYVFEELSVELLYADVWEGNVNSQKSLESYGYRLVETTTAFFAKSGTERKKYLYVLSKEVYLRNRQATSAIFPMLSQ